MLAPGVLESPKRARAAYTCIVPYPHIRPFVEISDIRPFVEISAHFHLGHFGAENGVMPPPPPPPPTPSPAPAPRAAAPLPLGREARAENAPPQPRIFSVF